MKLMSGAGNASAAMVAGLSEEEPQAAEAASAAQEPAVPDDPEVRAMFDAYFNK